MSSLKLHVKLNEECELDSNYGSYTHKYINYQIPKISLDEHKGMKIEQNVINYLHINLWHTHINTVMDETKSSAKHLPS